MTAMGIQLVVLMIVFSFIESHWPSSPAFKWWRRPFLVDLCGWSIHPLALAAGIALAIGSTEALLSEFPTQHLSVLRARVAALPAWAQIATATMMTDFLSYWIHRAYHRFPVLWAFHVIHHTSEELDWLSTSRLHPVSQVLNTGVVAAVLFLGGLPASAVVGANIFIGAAALLAHANVRWTFGPLRYLLVSPIFHQWHHARINDDVHHDKAGNFGAAFSVWDRLFGTWSLPSTKRPVNFGVADAPAPTIRGLLFHPLRACIRFFSNHLAASSAESKSAATPPHGHSEGNLKRNHR